MQRYFIPGQLVVGQTVSVDKETTKHMITVLRMQAGAQVELADATGTAFIAQIAQVEPLALTVQSEITKLVELPVAVTIVCGLGKAQKPELITQKATELGVTRIIFTNSQWATVRWQEGKIAKKLERLQLVAKGAAEQSHRNIVPTVDFLSKLTAATTVTADVRVIAYEESAKAGEHAALVQQLLAKPKSMVAVFGPEGGIAPAEVDQLEAAGFTKVGLGPRILRTETAPLYLLSAVSALTELTEGSI